MNSGTSATRNEPIPLPVARVTPFDPPPELEQFREHVPLRRMVYPDGHVGWLVTSHALGRAVLSDARFSARQELLRTQVHWPAGDARYGRHPAEPGIFIHMDPPEHTRYRRLLTGQFTVRKLSGLTPRIEQIVEQHLDAIERRGPPADLVKAFAWPIPSLAICELLGVPYADHPEFHRLNQVITSLQTTTEEGAQAWDALSHFFQRLAWQKRAHPQDDLLSSLTWGGELNDDEIAGIGLLLHRAGHETTASMLGLGTFALLSNPNQLDLLRTNPSLVEPAVEELLRYLTILQFGITRTALADTELDGQLIQEGEVITVSLPAANRDPAKFDHPDSLDLTRSTTGHLAFGHGIHQCLGQHLARIEMRVGYTALLRRFPSLRLATPATQVPLAANMGFYGVHQLLVAW